MLSTAQAAETTQQATAQTIDKSLIDEAKAFKTQSNTQSSNPTETAIPSNLIDEAKAFKIQQEQPSTIAKIKDFFTGDLRKTKDTESHPDWMNMPEFAQHVIDAKNNENSPDGLSPIESFGRNLKYRASVLTADPKEITQVTQHIFPGVKIRQDEKGNYLMTSGVNGKDYAIKPGVTYGDVFRGLGTLGTYMLGGEVAAAPKLLGAKAATVAGQAASGAATQAGIEAVKSANGGDFNVGNVAASGVIPPIFHGLGKLVGSTGAKLHEAIKSLLPNPKPIITQAPADIAAAAEQIKPAIQAAQPLAESQPHLNISQSETNTANLQANAAADDALAAQKQAAYDAEQANADLAFTKNINEQDPTLLQGQDLAELALKAGAGNKKAVDKLAQQVAPNKETVDAATRLGVLDDLQPDHITTNQAVRTMAQSLKSIPESPLKAAEKETMLKLGKTADDFITKLGGKSDTSTLSDDIKQQFGKLHEDTKAEAQAIYENINKKIKLKSASASVPVETPNLNATIKELVAGSNNDIKNLSKAEQSVFNKLQPKNGVKPTYDMLDRVRKSLNDAKGFNAKGDFAGIDDRTNTMLSHALRADQESAVAKYGLADDWNMAQAKSQLYLGMQNDITELFGKASEGSLVGNLSKSVKSLPTGDITQFTRLIDATKHLPKETREEIVASGLHTAFGKNLVNGNFTPLEYVQWYEGLATHKKAYTALMANLPKESRQSLSDLYKVYKSVQTSRKEFIGTGRAGMSPVVEMSKRLEASDRLISRLYQAAKMSGGRLATGIGSDLIGTHGVGTALAVGSILQKAQTPVKASIAKLIASPEFKEAIVNPVAPTIKRLAYSKQFTQFMRKLDNQKTIGDREKWIIQSLQAENNGVQK